MSSSATCCSKSIVCYISELPYWITAYVSIGTSRLQPWWETKSPTQSTDLIFGTWQNQWGKTWLLLQKRVDRLSPLDFFLHKLSVVECCYSQWGSTSLPRELELIVYHAGKLAKKHEKLEKFRGRAQKSTRPSLSCHFSWGKKFWNQAFSEVNRS